MPVFTLTSTSYAGTVAYPDPIETALFGEDLLFDDDLQLTASGDYAYVSGTAAVRQAILVRLLTAPGEYAVRPDFGVGIRSWVKKRLTVSEIDTLRQLVIDQLTKETRIERVESVIVERITTNDLTGISVKVKATIIGREQSFAYNTFSE